MPDLLSHILVIFIVSSLTKVKGKSLLLLGALLPDIISKIILIAFFTQLPFTLLSGMTLFHSIMLMFFVVLFISAFFKDFFRASYLLFVGALSHLMLDVFNTHYLSGMWLFFPFSLQQYRIDLYWPDEYYVMLLPLLAVYGFLLFAKTYDLRKRILG